MNFARYRFAVAFSFLFVFFGIAVQPVSATLPTPNQPILVVQNTASADPYQNFVPELLTTEGLNGFQTAQLPELTAAFLTNYDLVILPHFTLTAAQVTLFQNYVSAGGTLVGFRPDLQLASVFGVSSLGSTLPEGWLKIITTTPYGSGLDGTVMKFHGTADLYSISGATAMATLYNNPNSPTVSPAASIYTFGLGKSILFSYDLTQSIVLMRQGNPAWAGYPNTHDGFNTLRASQMFMDQPSGQFWNDLGDNALNDVPQADIQLRLFSNAAILANAAKRPLPRFWYFPNQSRALLLMTGDHHGDAVANSTNEINWITSYGGKFSEFLWYPFGAISNSQVNTWVAAGHAMGIHFDATAQADSSGVGGSAVTWSGMQSVLSTAVSSFTATYPTAPAPTTTRNHFLIWVSRNSAGSPDQTAQAKLFQAAGVQFDVSYTAFPNRWGYMTGSGLPMKFLDGTTGAVIPVFEQATQFEDDVQLGNATYSTKWSLATAQTHYQKALSDSLTKYNTVVTMLFHPDTWSTYQNYADFVLQYAQAQSIPMMSTSGWLQFWKDRATATLTKPTFVSNTLAFTATAPSAGLTLLVPNISGGNLISVYRVDGVAQTITTSTYQGVAYVGSALTAGTHSISVTYSPGGKIAGQISPSSAAATTTIQVQGGSINQTISPAADGTFATTALPSGTYTVTPISTSFTFSPTSRSVTVGSVDVTGINFTASVVTGQTLFTTQTPGAANFTDGPNVNYELGTAFNSASAGQIMGIRFWKAASESGTHVGQLWTSTGQLLASVTFANETASGWQQQPLAAPVAIAANTNYVVSVNTANAFYVVTSGGLATQIVNGNLKSVVGNNGLYGTSGSFPPSTYQSENYFRDVLFVPGTTYTISGTITPAASGSGTTVTLSGATSATATADASGNYSFAGLSNGSYTVTPTKAGFSFSPTSTPVTVNGANVAANFTAAVIPTFTISGAITPAAGGSGTTVTLSGAASATATADANGNYSFAGLSNGSYTVTPTKTGFTFSPVSTTLTVNGANVTANFTATAVPTFTISGAITPAASGSGATVTLSGASSATTTADASGNYSFAGRANGSYTVTPTKTGFTFSPVSTTLTVNGANATANFTATAVPTFTISGAITPAASGSGATVTLSGAASATTTADANGNYSFTGRANGSYTVTPSKTGLTFTPANAAVTVSNANVTVTTFTAAGGIAGQPLLTTQTPVLTNETDGPGLNYELGMSFTSTAAGQITGVRFWKAASETGTHTGKIWSSTGALLASVAFAGETVSGWQQQALTVPLSIAANTTYVVSVNTGNTFYVATSSGLATQIANGTLRSIVGNNGLFGSTGAFPTSSWQNANYFRDVLFVPAATYTVSGTITPAASGSGTTVTLSGASSATATADASGNYSFTGLSNGSYTVTPAKTGFSFSPASSPVTVNGASVTANFTAAAIPTFTISGAITPAASGSGATVTLSGAASATTTADVNGNYSFTGRANGSYTVTPTKTGFTFSPVSTTLTVNGANATANFTAAAIPTFTISGAITPAASGSGATVTLSGAASATTTADVNGNYSFTGRANGSYTVTPSKTGLTFTPANAAVTVNNANVTVTTFTAAVNANQSLFTTQTPALTSESDGAGADYELGMAFTSTAAGRITAVRFWKSANETGTHIGKIWSSTGALLASVTFTGETASGWQVQALPASLSIAASTTYVVSVNTGNTFYVATNSGLAAQISSGNLRSVVGGNGVYGSSGTFPTSSWLDSNYFRDVVFVTP